MKQMIAKQNDIIEKQGSMNEMTRHISAPTIITTTRWSASAKARVFDSNLTFSLFMIVFMH